MYYDCCPSGLQKLIDICVKYSLHNSLSFNPAKSVCIVLRQYDLRYIASQCFEYCAYCIISRNFFWEKLCIVLYNRDLLSF